MTIRLWGVEQVVNQTLDGTQRDSDVATLADGRVIVVWQNNPLTGNQVLARFYNPDGTPASSEFTISGGVGIAFW